MEKIDGYYISKTSHKVRPYEVTSHTGTVVGRAWTSNDARSVIQNELRAQDGEFYRAAAAETETMVDSWEDQP